MSSVNQNHMELDDVEGNVEEWLEHQAPLADEDGDGDESEGENESMKNESNCNKRSCTTSKPDKIKVWEHCKKLEDSNSPRAKCSYCSQTFACHLSKNGSVNYECGKQGVASRRKDKEVEIGVEAVRTNDKGKAVVVECFSCPPIERTRRFWDDIEDEGSDIAENCVNLSKTCTRRGPRRKKKRKTMPPALPREFVEEQTKYFAEIDAFELEEEIVSESELE